MKMNSPNRSFYDDEEDDQGEVFLDDSDIIHEVAVDEEDLPDADDEDDDTDDSMHIFTGHTSELYSVACSPSDPLLVATGGGDDKGFLWKIGIGDWASELKGHKESVSSLIFSSDGQLLASGGFDGLVQIWDASSGNLKCVLEGPDEGIEWVRWHPKGHLVLAGSEDKSVWMWNADKGVYLNSFAGHEASVTCGDFTPDGKTICTGSDDASLRIWNPKSGENIHVVKDMNDQEIVDATKSSKGVGAVSTSIDSDTNSSQRVTTVLLNGFNYLPWSRAVTIALGGRSRLGFINGKDKAPDSSSSDFENWLAKDQMVMSWILNSMERNLAEIFSYYQSSLELWEAVKDMYGNQNNSARIFQIQQDIAKLHQNGQPFVNLLSRLKSLWNELEVYRPHSVDPTVLRNRTEEDQIFQLLASLGSEFEDLRSHILMTAELPSLKSVCSTIQREEIRRKVMTRDSSINIPEGRAFAAHQRDQSAEKKFFKGKRPDLKCEFCNFIGHSQDRCWSLHPELKPKSFKDKLGGNQKRFPTHRAHLAAQATNSIPSSPMSLLNEFASFLQGKHNFGGDGAGNDEPTALLSKFVGLSTGGNSEHCQGPLHQTEDW